MSSIATTPGDITNLKLHVAQLTEQVASTEAQAARESNELIRQIPEFVETYKQKREQLQQIIALNEQARVLEKNSYELSKKKWNVDLSAKISEVTELNERVRVLEEENKQLKAAQTAVLSAKTSEITALNGRVKVLEEENKQLKADIATRAPLSHDQLEALPNAPETSREDGALEDRESIVSSEETVISTSSFSQFRCTDPQKIANKLLLCISELMGDTAVGLSSHSQGITITLYDQTKLKSNALLATVQRQLQGAYIINNKGVICLLQDRLKDTYVRKFEAWFVAEQHQLELKQHIQDQTKVLLQDRGVNALS